MKVAAIGLQEAIDHLKRYQNYLDSKLHLIIERLGNEGIEVARASYTSAQYDGEKDISVTMEWVSDTEGYVVASGTKVLFIEFGTGLIGYGHPQASEFGYGPGTWSDNESLGGKHHWKDPEGWYYAHGLKSKGNPPSMSMYNAGKEMHSRVEAIVKEVFS